MKCNRAARLAAVVQIAAVGLVAVQADTIQLKNGVKFDGVVTAVPAQEGLFKVTAGDRTLFYRESEIEVVEKNDKTGHLDKEALKARWEETNAKLTEETGLTAEQRRLVRKLMYDLKSDDVSKYIVVRDKFIAMQAEVDVYGYLVTLYHELSPLLAPNVLRLLTELAPLRSVPLLVEEAESNYFGVRAIAVEMLGRLRANENVTIIARGLVDHTQGVRISALYALASMGIREATPAMITLLSDNDLRVAGATRESLLALWADALGDSNPKTPEEWQAFWKAQTVAASPIELAGLAPLSPEEEELKQTYDSNG